MATIHTDQLRAARALAHLDQQELARRANTSVITIRRLESPKEARRVAPDVMQRVRNALETMGVEFIENGVRWQSRTENPALLTRDLMQIAQRSADRLKAVAPLTEADLYDENGLPA